MQKRPGITAVIIHKNRILLLKRRKVPIILNPGIWAFLSGGRNRNEKYLQTAYREIEEESGISKGHLRLLKSSNAMLVDRRKGIMWQNRLFIFSSDTKKVRLDYENSSFRWATLREIENQINYTNAFINEKKVTRAIKGFMHESDKSKG